MVFKRISLAAAGLLVMAALATAAWAYQPPAKPGDQPPAKPATPATQPPAAGAPAAQPAAGDVELAWKFTKGGVFFQRLKTTTNQTMKIMGTNVDQKNETEFVF